MPTLAIVGWGNAGQFIHCPLAQAAGFQITAVVSSQSERVRASLPDVSVYDSVASLIKNAPADMVVLATPNSLHSQQIESCLPCFRMVVVEKPLATGMSEARGILEQAQRHPHRLTVFHNRRWDSDFLTVKRIVLSGALGGLHTVKMHWDRFRPTVLPRWRERPDQGGGLLLDLGPHLIDQALQLFGRPDWIEAELFTHRVGAGAEDAFVIRLGMGTLRVDLCADSLIALPRPRFELHGSLGSFVKYGLDTQEQSLKEGRSPLDSDFGNEPAENYGEMVSGTPLSSQRVASEKGCWNTYYEQLRQCLAGAAALPVDPADAVLGLQIIESAREAAKSTRRLKFEHLQR